jgi:hypothetical protein
MKGEGVDTNPFVDVGCAPALSPKRKRFPPPELVEGELAGG